jgi:hypothetical protein
MKRNTVLQQNIWFLWACISRDENKYILSLANKQKALTMVSLTTANISPILCSTILGYYQQGVLTANHQLPLLTCMLVLAV